jgi:hypothetical protein
MAQGVLTGPVRTVTLETAADEMLEIEISAEAGTAANRGSGTVAVEIVSVTATSAAIREAGRAHSEERIRGRGPTLRATEASPVLGRAVLEGARQGHPAPVLEAEAADPEEAPDPAAGAVVEAADDVNYLARGEQTQ